MSNAITHAVHNCVSLCKIDELAQLEESVFNMNFNKRRRWRQAKWNNFKAKQQEKKRTKKKLKQNYAPKTANEALQQIDEKWKVFSFDEVFNLKCA